MQQEIEKDYLIPVSALVFLIDREAETHQDEDGIITGDCLKLELLRELLERYSPGRKIKFQWEEP